MERDRPADQPPGPDGLTSGDPLRGGPALGGSGPAPGGSGPASTDPGAVAASAGLGGADEPPTTGDPAFARDRAAGAPGDRAPAPPSGPPAPSGWGAGATGATSAFGGAPTREQVPGGWAAGTAEPGLPPAPPGYGAGPVPPGAWGAPPPGPRPVFELASWGRRVGAFVIDGLIVGVVALAVLLLMVAAFGGVGFVGGDETGYVGLVLGALIGGLVAFLISLVYAPLWMSRTNGRTLGRQVMGIRVVRANGQPTDFWWSALRESVLKTLVFGGIGSGATFGLAWLADVLWPLWDDQNRALHDIIVDSRVVRD